MTMALTTMRRLLTVLFLVIFLLIGVACGGDVAAAVVTPLAVVTMPSHAAVVTRSTPHRPAPPVAARFGASFQVEEARPPKRAGTH